MLMNCPRGWFLEGLAPAGDVEGVPLAGPGAWLGAGVATGAFTRVTGAAGLTGRACRRLR